MLSDLGEFVKAPSSTVEPPVVKRFEDKYGADLAAKAEEKAAKKAAKKAPAKKAAAAPAEVSGRRPRRGAGPGARRAGCRRGAVRAPLQAGTPSPQGRRGSSGARRPRPRSRPPSRSTTRRPSLPLRPGTDGGDEAAAPPRAPAPASSPARARPAPAPRARATTRSPRPRAWAAGPRRPPVARLHRVPVAATSARPARRRGRDGMPRPNPAMMPKSPAAFGNAPGGRGGPGGPGGRGGPGGPGGPGGRGGAPARGGAPGRGGFGGGGGAPAWVAPVVPPAGDPVVPDEAVPASAAAPRVPSGGPVVPRAVDASPSGHVVKSSSRWKRRPLAACASARATARPFAWRAAPR